VEHLSVPSFVLNNLTQVFMARLSGVLIQDVLNTVNLSLVTY